jgi:ankyrin repeat protein
MKFITANLITVVLLICLAEFGFAQNESAEPVPDSTQTVPPDPDYELLLAAGEGDTAAINNWIEKGANVNCRSVYDEVTPLMYAAQNGHLESVILLLHRGARVNDLPQNHVSALLGACIAGHVFIADTLILNGADVNTKNFDGVTPLMVAAAYNDSVMADMLIFYKATIEIQDVQGNSPLIYSAYYNSWSVTELLLEKSANVNISDINGFTPLMIATQKEDVYTANLFIQHGANVNATNKNNLTALSLAITMNNYEIANLLIENGADVHHKISIARNQLSLAQEFADSQMQQLLIHHGALSIQTPVIDKVIVALDINGNLDDLMTGGKVSVAGSRLGVELEAGYKTRIWVRSVLYEINPKTYYQFWESRSVMHIGANKLFNVFKKTVQYRSGVFAGVNFGYTYGNFRGSEKKPDDEFLIIPKAGVFWSSRSFDAKFNYEYMKFANTKVSPHHFNLTIGFNINLSNTRITLKEKPEW